MAQDPCDEDLLINFPLKIEQTLVCHYFPYLFSFCPLKSPYDCSANLYICNIIKQCNKKTFLSLSLSLSMDGWMNGHPIGSSKFCQLLRHWRAVPAICHTHHLIFNYVKIAFRSLARGAAVRTFGLQEITISVGNSPSNTKLLMLKDVLFWRVSVFVLWELQDMWVNNPRCTRSSWSTK